MDRPSQSCKLGYLYYYSRRSWSLSQRSACFVRLALGACQFQSGIAKDNLIAHIGIAAVGGRQRQESIVVADGDIDRHGTNKTIDFAAFESHLPIDQHPDIRRDVGALRAQGFHVSRYGPETAKPYGQGCSDEWLPGRT